MAIKITCINKDGGNHFNSHEAIQYLGWVEVNGNRKGKSSRLEVVKFIEEGNFAYTEDGFGNKAYLYVRTSSSGNKFVQTMSDGRFTNNLLSLLECK